MKLNVQTDYALRVLMQVALQAGELVRMRDIAEKFEISHNHLTKVVHRLATLGYLTTVQGRHGGMRLARPAELIGVGQIVRDFEPDLNLVECMNLATSQCRIQSGCVLQSVFQNAMESFFRDLDEATLATLVRPHRKLQTLLSLPIRHITRKASSSKEYNS